MGEYVEHEEITHNNPILVTDITTGEMRVFSGVKEVSKALYCNQSNVSHRAKDGRLLFKKYSLRRLNYVGEAKEIGAKLPLFLRLKTATKTATKRQNVAVQP